MQHFFIEDLVVDMDLDRQALAAIQGSGLFGSVNRKLQRVRRRARRALKTTIGHVFPDWFNNGKRRTRDRRRR